MKLNQLAHYLPSGIKSWIPASLKDRVRGSEIDQRLNLFPQTSRLPELPENETFDSMFKFLSEVQLVGVNPEVMSGYLNEAYLRFLHTLALVPEQSGKLLELGANPYFMTTLLEQYRNYNLVLANYYDTESGSIASQYQANKQDEQIERKYHNFNIEQSPFPFDDNSFDAVLFCEILEHLTSDPLHTLKEIKRVLKPNGNLILTTPNVSRLENIIRIAAGENIYDPYSGYGPYGRHNREYTLKELKAWLEDLGFQIDVAFTSDVRPHHTGELANSRKIWKQYSSQDGLLGQYCFVRAINKNEIKIERPEWLFRAFD